MGLSPDGSVVYACTDATSERARLEAGALVVGRPDAELEAVALSGDGRVAALTWNVDGGVSALTIVDVASGHQREVTALPRSVVHRCRLSHDGGVVVVTAEGPSDPKGVWHGPTGSSLSPLSSPGLAEAWIGAVAVSKYGDPVRDRELLADLSPLHVMVRLRAPLLLVHGADDTNVPASESVQVAAALHARGAPHRLLLFEGEGHELLATANRVHFVQATTDWLTAHLEIPV